MKLTFKKEKIESKVGVVGATCDFCGEYSSNCFRSQIEAFSDKIITEQQYASPTKPKLGLLSLTKYYIKNFSLQEVIVKRKFELVPGDIDICLGCVKQMAAYKEAK